MLKKYNDFLFESLLLESVLFYSNTFKDIIKNIDSPVSIALLGIESKDLKVSNNYIDISDDKEMISFIPDRKAQELLNPKDGKEKATCISVSGFLRHTESNNDIFEKLEYTPVGSGCYQPSIGESGDVLKIATSDVSNNVYLKIQFPRGLTVINERCISYDNLKKNPFNFNRQSVKVGRGVKSILSSGGFTFTNSEIEQFVNKYKSEYDKYNDIFRYFDLVEGEDIATYYNYSRYEYGSRKGSLSNSCMSAVSSRFFQIYTNNPEVCKLLILRSENNGDLIKGRALVWILDTPKNITYMDRVYTHDDSDVELFKNYAVSKGWYHKRLNQSCASTDMISGTSSIDESYICVKVKAEDYSYYPYLDTLKYYSPTEGLLTTGRDDSSDYILEDTGGGYSNSYECDYCGGDQRVDCYECEGSGVVSCSECNGEGSNQCGDCDGDGKIDCSGCEGDGEVDCSECDGSGEKDGEKCTKCEGHGKENCEECDGHGKENCEECDGYGKINCDYCDSDGERSCRVCDGEGRLDCPECT